MTSGVDTQHPLFVAREPDLKIMRDAVEGERQIKAAGTTYLKPTSGMIEDGILVGQPGWAAYDAYRSRARYPDLVSEAVESLLGVMHRKPPTIELPESMEDMREKITIRGESMDMLLRRINEEQLTTGRVGLIGDVIGTGDREGELYVAMYHGEKPINWDEGANDADEPNKLQLVVIDETAQERVDTFTWEEKKKYRVLMLGDGQPIEPDEDGDAPAPEGPYGVTVVDDGETFDPSSIQTPNIQGRTSEEIPFVFINTKDVVPQPDAPPMLGLANLCLAIYRGEADYRQALFMQGQDTLVTIGLANAEDEDGEKVRVGANAHINIPNVAGDAKYIGVESDGLPEMRSALENDYDRAAQRGGQLLDTVGGPAESGEALRIRVSASTATLTQIAITGAFGLQSLLRILARWMGADAEAVIVTPHLDFVASAGSKTIVELTTAKTLGAPLSWETIHERAQEEGVTEISFEEEKERLMAESEDEALNLRGPDTEEGDPEEEEDMEGEGEGEPEDEPDPNDDSED